MPNKDLQKHKENMAAWYQKNKEEVKERSRARHQENKEEIKAQQASRRANRSAQEIEEDKEYARAYYKANKEKISERSKEAAKSNPEKKRLRGRKYGYKQIGWTLEAYNAAFIEQGGTCAICKQTVEGSVLDADHEHSDPPKPRGLLCHLCNIGIGAFKDSPTRLEEAIKYLRKYDSDAEKKDC